jgi:glucokinase
MILAGDVGGTKTNLALYRREAHGLLRVNDLQATASSLPFLQESDRATIQEGEADPRGNMAVVAAGTGLGEGFLVGSVAGHIPLASEGGHADFAPVILPALRQAGSSGIRPVSVPDPISVYRLEV